MKKIMIADDNSLSAEGIQKGIDWKGLKARVVHVCYNGESAMEAMKEEPVDVILSDIEMPGLDGISMAKQALAMNPMAKVILISAYDRFDYARQAIRGGIYDYIEKPIDYAYLTDKIRDACELIDQEAHNLELLNQSRPLMTEKFFNGLLRCAGKEAAYNLSSYIEYLGLDLDYKFFAVILFHIENAPELKSAAGVQAYEMLLFRLYDAVDRCCEIFDRHDLIKDFNGLTSIICQNSAHSSHVLQAVHKMASAVIESCQNTGLSLNIGIGNIADDLWNVNLSWESAAHALEYRFFFPQKNVFDTKEALGKDLSLEPFSDMYEEELIQLICKKDYHAMEDCIKAFSFRLLQKYPSKNFLFIRVYSLLGRILKFLYELDIDAGDIEKAIIKAYTRSDAFHTNEQLFSWLYGICATACGKLNASLKSYHRQLCKTVQKYIEENYECSELCLHDIAKHVNVSPAYLSALYKKNMQISISDTMTAVRIEAACKYLINSAFSLKEISERCGYANQYYFSTSFKKKQGMSPSAYRERKAKD